MRRPIVEKGIAAALACALLFSSCGAPQEEDDALSSDNQPSVSAGDESGSLILSDEQTRQIADMVIQCAHAIPDEFSSPKAIPVYTMTRFLYGRMALDGITDSFERSEDGQAVRVPVERVREYAATYFGLSELNFDFASLRYFDGQFVTIPLPGEEEESPVEFDIGRIEPGAGRVSVTLDLSSGGVGYERRTYTLRSDAQGRLSISSMIRRPAEYGLYAVHNAVTPQTILEVPVNSMTADAFHFIPFGERMLAVFSNGKTLRVGYLDLDTGKSETDVTFDLTDEAGRWDIQVLGDRFAVFLPDRALVLNEALSILQTLPYPQALLSQCDSYTGGFLLSPDLKYLAYTNAAGLQFYSFQSSENILMQSNTMNVLDRSIPEMTWEPLAFSERTGALLAQLSTSGGGIDKFGIFSTQNPNNALENTIRVRGDKDTLVEVRDGRLLVFAPTSVRIPNVNADAPLDRSCVDYNLATGTARFYATDFMLGNQSVATSTSRMLLSGDFLYRTEEIAIGEDMVSSYSIHMFRNPNDNQLVERQAIADFGYVDRQAQLRLLATSAQNRLVASCNGMFIHAVVII